MEKQNKTLSNILTSIGLLLIIPGLILAFTPMRMFGILFAGVALILSGIAFLIIQKKKLKKTYSLFVMTLAFATLLIVGLSQIFSENTVDMEDNIIEEREEEANDIEDELDDLEDILNEIEEE